MGKKTPEEIMESIETVLMESKEPLSLNEISQRTKVYPSTLKRYVGFIIKVQIMPKIEVIETKAATLVQLKELSSLPEEEQVKVIKSHFPCITPEIEFLVGLLKEKAVSPESAIQVKGSPLIKKLLEQQHVIKTREGKIYLSETGKIIAKGATEVYY